MCNISYKFVKNESYKDFMNICEPNLAYFRSFLLKIDLNYGKNLPYQTILIKSNKNVKCKRYKYL
jgi:hypothetical protein